jgi:ribonuclease HI
MTYEVYVDGTFYNGMYGGGYVVYQNGEITYQDCGVGKNDPELISMRNISGEMTAAMRAANWVKRHRGKAVIYHDYNGLGYWGRKEWKRNNKYTNMYADYMFPLYRDGIITFEWVKGHKGIEGNEIADRLAKQAVVYKQPWKF